MKFAVIIEKSNDGWYVGQLEEIPVVLSQGKTIAELKEYLLDAQLIPMEIEPWKTCQYEFLININN